MTGSSTNSGADFLTQLRSPLDPSMAVGMVAPGDPLSDPLNLTLSNRSSLTSASLNEALLPVEGFEASSIFTSGWFTVGNTGQVSVDYLYDGGLYEGDVGVFSLDGLDQLVPGSTEFIQTVVQRVLSNSTLGHLIISDKNEGARFESNFNAGDYLGIKTFEMKAGDRFGMVLVPNGTFYELAQDPTLDGSKRPLFSLSTANPKEGFQFGQIADATGNGSTFVFEDLRVDGESDRDYEDIVLQVRGAIGFAPSLDEVINPGSEWRNSTMGQAILNYIAPYDNPIGSQSGDYQFSQSNQPLIGIIDTGFATNNPDIDYNRIILGRDYVDGDTNPLLAPGEGNEHGTHILGIIGATQNNGIGIDGINGQAPIWLGRAIGSGQWAESLVEFVNQALETNQPNAVVNLSLDLTQRNPDGTITTRYEFTPEERAALEYARQNAVLIVAAAGNDGGVMSALGQASQEFDNIIAVGAADGHNRADYSSYGYGLDILAPGGTSTSPAISTVGDGLGRMAGTSVATAYVTGAVSQVWTANPDLSYRQVIDLIKATAVDVATPGWDRETGVGLLNEAAAIALAQSTVGKSYTPTPWFSPDTWSGAGIAQPLERAANGTNQPTAGQIPNNPGTFLGTEVSNGVTIHRYTGGYLIVQPNGSQRWYFIGSGLASFNTDITGNPIPSTRKSPQPDNGNQPNENGNQGATPKPDAVYFADVDGDRDDDAIVVNNWGTTVRFSNGTNQFLPNTELTSNPFFGSKRTYFTDVTGDGRADGIVVNNDGVYVRAYNGIGFANPVKWTEQGYFGDKGTFFTDVNGDNRADAIVVNSQQSTGIPGVTIRLSTGTSFGSNQHWINEPYDGDKGTFFADVNGDGMADAIAVNSENRPGIDGVFVRLSTGNGFGAAQRWTNEIYYGDKGTFFADVNGDGRADAIAVNSEAALGLQGVTVRLSTGSNFGTPVTQEKWTDNAYYGDKGIYFADVTGDGQADAIVSNEKGVGDVVGVTVRPSNGFDFLSNQNWTNGFPYYGTGGHGSLVRAIGQPEVYLIEGNERRWIPNPETLRSLGLEGKLIHELSTEDLNGIPLGADIPSVSIGGGSPLPVSAAAAMPFFKLQYRHATFNPTGPLSSSNCGPASLAMLMSTIGVMPRGISIETAIDHARYLGDPRSTGVREGVIVRDRDGDITHMSQLEVGIRSAGGRAEPVRSWEVLDQQLTRGNPMIVLGRYDQRWRDQFPNPGLAGTGTDDHFIAILGRTPDNRYIVADPMYQGGPVEMTRDQLAVFFRAASRSTPVGVPDGRVFVRG